MCQVYYQVFLSFSHELLCTLKRCLQRNTFGIILFGAIRAWFHGFSEFKWISSGYIQAIQNQVKWKTRCTHKHD